jgi:hypothetical protein
MIVERTGDLFSRDCPALGQGVNTLGSMGTGTAVEGRRWWPALDAAYREACVRPAAIPALTHAEVMRELLWLLLTTVLTWARPRQGLVLDTRPQGLALLEACPSLARLLL